MLDNKTLINNIKNLCESNDIRITKLEKELGFGAGIINRWGNEADPSLSKIIQIADYFNVSIDEVVRHNDGLNDDFINLLCETTNKKEVSWSNVKDTMENVGKPQRNPILEPYDEELYSEKCYFMKYQNGYIILYCFYRYGRLLNPTELILYIQPPNQDNYYAIQPYSTNELKTLWMTVLRNLKDIPIEIKAEDFKNQFINNFMSPNILEPN